MSVMQIFWISIACWTILVCAIAVFYERREQRNHARWLERTRANRVRAARHTSVSGVKDYSDGKVMTLEDMLEIRPVGIDHGDESRPE